MKMSLKIDVSLIVVVGSLLGKKRKFKSFLSFRTWKLWKLILGGDELKGNNGMNDKDKEKRKQERPQGSSWKKTEGSTEGTH